MPIKRRATLLARLRDELSFRLWVDITTMLASIAAVVTLVLLLRDRPMGENTSAWQLLESYLVQHPRPRFNEGQVFAMETLTSNHVELTNIDAAGIDLRNAQLQGIVAVGGSFIDAYMQEDNLSGGDFRWSRFRNATLKWCECREISFEGADLTGASLLGGSYDRANFHGADISGIVIGTNYSGMSMDEDAMQDACFDKSHPPDLGGVKSPLYPQSDACVAAWGKQWASKR
ncbi:pentapeptide repeat-containing protein [Caballeronia sp. ATUFL_M2_KS44]|uniref:pentapeptide repeat-containing protein n=1 Tax=Caballeronia sp. ATUFL_M2_KS44 TaxID=2921767 RepID=UPI00202936E8|nr:pentapeptide repeat-containing protein [Caballeronia sp. ATUFL_M2_KS44]